MSMHTFNVDTAVRCTLLSLGPTLTEGKGWERNSNASGQQSAFSGQPNPTEERRYEAYPTSVVAFLHCPAGVLVMDQYGRSAGRAGWSVTVPRSVPRAFRRAAARPVATA